MRVLLVVALLLVCVSARISLGKIDNTKQKTPVYFEYVDKFAFATGLGKASLQVTWEKPEKFKQDIVIFDDEKSSWPAIYKEHKHGKGNCEDVIAKAKYHYVLEAGQKKEIDFKESANWHLWYFAAVDCDAGEINFDYEFTFENAAHNHPAWQIQLGFNEWHVPAIFIAFAVILSIGALAHIYTVVQFVKDGKYHSIVRLLTVAIIAELLYSWFGAIHWGTYAKNGLGVPGLLLFGQIIDLLAQVVIMLIVLLVAQGWAVSAISLRDQKKLVVILGGLLIVYVCMDLWKQLGHEPAKAVYHWETAPGIIILLLRVAAAVYFCFSLYKTITTKHEAYAKVSFYTLFGIIFGLWFLVLPILVLLAEAASAAFRERIVTGVYFFMNLLALATLSGMLWPSMAEKFFVVSDPSPLTIDDDIVGTPEATEAPVSAGAQGYGSL